MRRLGLILANVVALAAASTACEALTGQSSCGDTPDPKNVTVSSVEACALAAQSTNSPYGNRGSHVRCPASCGDHNSCYIDDAYFASYQAANPPPADADSDASAPTGAAAATSCPAVASNEVPVKCTTYCEGRRTEGIAEASGRADSLGEYFATCAYLEAVSVLAFERLHEELSHHGAPGALLERVEQARREEVRHTELTRDLARRFGTEPCAPDAQVFGRVRSLFDIARENAVEGCVRETYGAALALMRAERAADACVREVAREIAHDEVGHAELAWDLSSWILPRLTPSERAEIELAVRVTVAELIDDRAAEPGIASAGMPSPEERARLIALLDANVFRSDAHDRTGTLSSSGREACT